MPNSSPLPFFYDGAIHGASRQILNQTFEQALVASATVVQATNPTAAANLMTAALQGGTLARVGQSLQIWGAGITNLTTATATLTIAVIYGGVTIATIVTGAVAVGALNLPWQLSLIATVASVDATGNITLETHGNLSQALTTTTAGLTTYNDVNNAVSSSINAAIAQTLQIQATISAGNAASFVNQRQLIVDLLN